MSESFCFYAQAEGLVTSAVNGHKGAWVAQ